MIIVKKLENASKCMEKSKTHKTTPLPGENNC